MTKLDVSGGASDVALSATVSQTTVAAGGSFKVKYTVSKNTDRPVTGDLGFTAKRNSNVVAQGQVLSNTAVAVKSARSGSYVQPVPANTAPGVYTYTVHIGQAPDHSKDKVTFMITVTDAAQAGGSATAWQAVKRN